VIMPLYEFDDEWRNRIIKMHLEMRGNKVTGLVEGTYGDVYSIVSNDSCRTRVAAKCPRITKFGSLEKARIGVERLLHELDKTHRVFMVPWINRFFDVQIIHGWPFILSRYRDGSLEDLIANPLAWSLQDRFASLIQIVRALRLAREGGIAAHQDLKPGNVFFDTGPDAYRKTALPARAGMNRSSGDASTGVQALPARAGMNRAEPQARSGLFRAPRTRGDEPVVHTGDHTGDQALPARAGMNRSAR
jgi:serine/threonine protein kinase